MGKEENRKKNSTKKVLKSFLTTILLPLVIVIILIITIIGSIYYIFKDDLKEMSKESQKYTSSAKIDPTNGIIHQTTTESGKVIDLTAEDIANNIKCLEDYIDDSDDKTKEEKLEYLLNAEAVTSFPYIDNLAEDKLNGVIKFYRYSSEEEAENAQNNADEENKKKCQITYISQEEFENLFNLYKSSGNEEIFKYFTIDDEQNAVIAYGTEETRIITTNDSEVTLDVVNQNSQKTYSATGDGSFSVITYTASKHKIDYKTLVQPYVVPFNLLASLLIQTRDYNMVKEIADLAYNTKLEIAIYDNKTITTTNENYSYNKSIQFTENTRLNFDNLNTNPQININSSNYSGIATSCIGSIRMSNNQYRAIHMRNAGTENVDITQGNSDDGYLYQLYVTAKDGSVITNLGNQTPDSAIFKVNLDTTIVSNSVPTVGITLADTWIAKYTVAYKKQTNNRESTNNKTLDDGEQKIISSSLESAQSTFASGLLQSDGIIGSKLEEHSKNLKDEAIEKIINNTNIVADSIAMTASDIRNHALSPCAECQTALNNHYRSYWHNDEYVSDSKLVNDVRTQSDLRIVYNHVSSILQNQQSQNTNIKKQKFESDLKEQITYTQWPTAQQKNVQVNLKSSTSRSSTQYIRDNTQIEKEGENFLKIFLNEKYNESKNAILNRSEWLWEYLRQNENTVQLEDIMRYLLNLATNSNKFGNFSEEEIKKLFEAFEPQELKNASFNGAVSIGQYLAQFGGDYTVYTFDGIDYYRIHNDSAGNPTVGAGDIQWKSNNYRFSSTFNLSDGTQLGLGTVRYGGTGGIVYENVDVQVKVNELLGGADTKWNSDYEPSEQNTIYIDKVTADKVANDIAMYFYDRVILETGGLNLSRQQLFALTYIVHATGNLDYVATSENSSSYKPFKTVYEEAQSNGFEPNSWEFNRYIWTNWWSTKWAGGYSARKIL